MKHLISTISDQFTLDHIRLVHLVHTLDYIRLVHCFWHSNVSRHSSSRINIPCIKRNTTFWQH